MPAMAHGDPERNATTTPHEGVPGSTAEVDHLVADAIDRLPAEFRRLVASVPVVVSEGGVKAHAYGSYIGDTVARDDFADVIVIYRDTLERDFGHDPTLLAEQVERTLRHELLHHLGGSEARARALGL
jgi:predicted Zn-dependent protease with MMP-like domain